MMKVPFTRGSGGIPPVIKIGALGPETTSTFRAAEFESVQLSERNVKAKIIPFESFESMRSSLDCCELDLGIVPAAMREANRFFFDLNLEIKAEFSLRLPDYGLVFNQRAFDAGNRVLVTREEPSPAVADLLTGIARPEDVTIRFVRSTCEAAEMVADGRAAFGITNETSAVHFGLKLLRMIPPVIMIWLVFGRRDVDLRFVAEIPRVA